MRFGSSELEWLLQHEIDLANRYRRFVSVVMFSEAKSESQSDDDLDVGVSLAMQKCVRSGDAVIHCSKDCGAVILSETDLENARRAVERWHKGYDELRFGVASFPNMNASAGELIQKALERLKKVEDASETFVMWSDVSTGS